MTLVPAAVPAAERELDAILLGISGGFGQALAASRFVPHVGDGGGSAPAIGMLLREFTTRSLTVVIENPEDPWPPGMWRSWYCRFVIEVSIEGRMVARTTILSFPETFDMARLTHFLQEPLMAGCPPTLSWCEGIDGAGAYCISLDTGEGAGWGRGDASAAQEFVRETVEEHLAVIEGMERLAEDWNYAAAFASVQRLAVAANAA